MVAPLKNKKLPEHTTRIRRKNINLILEAALEIFSNFGYNGATLDQIAKKSGLSKPNILYYFKSKRDIHLTLLNNLLDNWLEPLRALDPDGDPISEINSYVQRKLEMAKAFPRESRLFAMEILQGATHLEKFIKTDLKDLVDKKAAVINDWSTKKLISKVDSIHLIFSIWATTQHYSDFEAQINLITGNKATDPTIDAASHLKEMYTRVLKC